MYISRDHCIWKFAYLSIVAKDSTINGKLILNTREPLDLTDEKSFGLYLYLYADGRDAISSCPNMGVCIITTSF